MFHTRPFTTCYFIRHHSPGQHLLYNNVTISLHPGSIQLSSSNLAPSNSSFFQPLLSPCMTTNMYPWPSLYPLLLTTSQSPIKRRLAPISPSISPLNHLTSSPNHLFNFHGPSAPSVAPLRPSQIHTIPSLVSLTPLSPLTLYPVLQTYATPPGSHDTCAPQPLSSIAP